MPCGNDMDFAIGKFEALLSTGRFSTIGGLAGGLGRPGMPWGLEVVALLSLYVILSLLPLVRASLLAKKSCCGLDGFR